MTKKGNIRKWIAALTVMLITLSLNAQTINEVIEAFNAGAAEMNAGNFDAAIKGFENTIELATTLGAEGDEMKAKAEGQIPPIQYRMAMDSYKAKDYVGSIANFEKAVEASEKYGNEEIKGKSLRYIPQLYNAVGNSKVKSEDFEGALASFDKALEYKPDYARAIYGKALVYKRQNDEANMITTMETAIAVGNSTDDEKTGAAATKALKDYYLNNGKISFQAEEYDDALAYFEKSFKYDDQDPEPYFLITVIHVKQEKAEKVIQVGEKYLAFNEDDADKKARIYFELGNAYMTIIEYEKACEAFANAMVEPYLNSVKHKMENVLNCE